MNARRTLFSAVGVAACALAFCTAALGAAQPPAATAVLRAAAQVMGHLPTTGVHIRSAGSETADGLRGKWWLDEEPGTGRFAQQSDFGVYRTAEVFDGHHRWRQDRSGGVHALDAAFSRRRAQTDAWLMRHGYLRRRAEGARVTYSSERTEGGRRHDVIAATPRDGVPVELWFDSGTHLLHKAVVRMPIDNWTQRYADYRAVAGSRMPFRIVTEEGGSVDEVTVATREASPARAHADERPLQPDDTALAAATKVPVEIDGNVVVDAWLDGQGPYAFILDSGGHAILTPEVAAQLHLDAVGHGQSGGAGAGTLTQQDVRVPAMSIGDARFVDQHFYVIPLQYSTIERGDRPPIAGLLGVELLERLAARIDYRNRQLTLAPFDQAPALCHGRTLPITFDDDMPLVAGRVDGIDGTVAIDTGNSSSMVVQGVWAERHGLGHRMKEGLASVSFGSGGESPNWVSHGHRLDLGPISLTGLEVRYAEDRQGAFSSITEAANIGRQVLANFAVTFDYAGQRMCLEPGDPQPPPVFNRSGLTLSKTAPDRFTIVQVAPGSPGAVAGLRQGDLVMAIGQRPAATLSGRDVAAIIRGEPGTTLRLDVLRGGEGRTVALTLREPAV